MSGEETIHFVDVWSDGAFVARGSPEGYPHGRVSPDGRVYDPELDRWARNAVSWAVLRFAVRDWARYRRTRRPRPSDCRLPGKINVHEGMICLFPRDGDEG